MYGPVPVGNALNKIAQVAHSLGSLKTKMASKAVSIGCTNNLAMMSGMKDRVLGLFCFFDKNNPKDNKAQGEVADASISRSFRKSSPMGILRNE